MLLIQSNIPYRWSNARTITEVTMHMLVQLQYQLDWMKAKEVIIFILLSYFFNSYQFKIIFFNYLNYFIYAVYMEAIL